MNDPNPSLFDAVREDAWQLEQAIAHDDFVGHERDLSQVTRDVSNTLMLIIRLCDGLEAYREAVERA